MSSPNPWITLAQASARHAKSIATIRRWITLNPETIRTKLRDGTRYVHEDDVAKVAARHPVTIAPAARSACAESGHRPHPSPALVAELAHQLGNDHGQWIALGAAGRITGRSKSTLTLWIKKGEMRAVHCACQWRRFIWTPDLERADATHPYRRGAHRD